MGNEWSGVADGNIGSSLAFLRHDGWFFTEGVQCADESKDVQPHVHRRELLSAELQSVHESRPPQVQLFCITFKKIVDRQLLSDGNLRGSYCICHAMHKY